MTYKGYLGSVAYSEKDNLGNTIEHRLALIKSAQIATELVFIRRRSGGLRRAA